MAIGPASVERYLSPTPLCDIDHPAFSRTARQIRDASESKRDCAMRIFYHLRDTVLYGGSHFYAPASETYSARVGDSLAATNVHVALLRACRIPARFHCALVQKRVFEGLLPAAVYRWLPEEVGHAWPECRLNGRWIACEATFDSELYDAMLARGLFPRWRVPSIDWDGESDLVLLRAWITRDLETYDSFDDALAMLLLSRSHVIPPRFVDRYFGWALFGPTNRKIRAVRRIAETA